jgi:predicted AAA+ superfamily ATPase
LFPYIKLYADEVKKAGLFFMTGSQTFHLMKNITESLASRVGIIDLLGLSLREINRIPSSGAFLPNEQFLSASRKVHKAVKYNRLWEIIHRGSLPRLYTRPCNDESWLQFFRDYVRTYIERDLRSLSQIGDEQAFLRFLRLAAAHTGQELNYSNLASAVGKTTATIQHWISILAAAGIIYLLKPYSGNIQKRLIKSPKLYFLDTGLCAYLAGWYTSSQMQMGAMNGHFFQTFVIGEILKNHYNAGLGAEGFYFYRDKKQKEIDLIIEHNNTLYSIENKMTAKPGSADMADFSILKQVRGKTVGQGALIYPGAEELYLSETVKALPVSMI